MSLSAKHIAARFTKAISFPAVVLELDDMINDGVSNTSDFARLLSSDPGLTATLLKIANSPLYGFSGRVATVERAVSLVGMREIRDLVLSVAVRTTFDGISNEIQTMDDFWQHSLCCALASRQVAEAVRHPKRDVLYTAGLLHDIGHLAMFSQIPNVCTDAIRRAQEFDDVEMFELEPELIGFDHQEVVAEIAEAWGFPTLLRDTIEFHHLPGEAVEHQLESAIVHIGNSISVMVELGLTDFTFAPDISGFALGIVGIDEKRLLPMIPQVHTMFRDMRPVFRAAA